MSDAQGAPDSQLPAVVEGPELGSLLDAVIRETGAKSADDREAKAKAVAEVFREIFRKTAEHQFSVQDDRINSQILDDAIASIDRLIGQQLDEVMQHPKLQELESAWRSLRYLAERAPTSSNILIDLLSTDKHQLDDDLTSQRPDKSAYFHHLYSKHGGTFGGEPYGAVVTTFGFSATPRDMRLLKNLASCSSMAHAPLLAQANPDMLGLDSIGEMPMHGDQILDAQRTKEKELREWRRFRRSADSRYVALTLPRMMLRLPYGAASLPTQSFTYEERADGKPEHYLWGSSAFGLAACMARSFRENRWYDRIVGPAGGGTVDGLSSHTYDAGGLPEVLPATEVFLNDNVEYTLSRMGFAPLVMHKEEDYAVFFGVNTPYEGGHDGAGAEADAIRASGALQARLPYTLIVTRIAHYLKGMMRLELGRPVRSPEPLQKLANDWLQGYCWPNANPDDKRMMLEKPLKSAKVEVEDWPGRPGFYKFTIEVQPHFKFEGADIAISLDGFVSDGKSV
jgi:type VI secretion system protein ImpC